MPELHADEVNTSALFAAMCEEVKAGLIEVIAAEIVPPGEPVEGEKVARLHSRRVIDTSPEAFASKMRSPRHVEQQPSGEAPENEGDPQPLEDVQRVHAYMIGFGGVSGDGEDQSTGRKAFRLRLLIDSYYEDYFGTDADNAETRHASEVHRLAFAIYASLNLRRPGLVFKISEFRERRGFSRMGANTMTRESLAEVIVDLRAVPLPF